MCSKGEEEISFLNMKKKIKSIWLWNFKSQSKIMYLSNTKTESKKRR